MEEQSKYAFGVDVGTENVRAVALEIKGEDVKVIADLYNTAVVVA